MFLATLQTPPIRRLRCQPLSLVDIVVVAGPLGYRTPDEFLFFAEIIGGMDQEFLSYFNERQKIESASKAKNR